VASVNPFRRHMLVLRLDAGGLLEAFLVSAVTAFLIIRFVLAVAEYPTLGAGHLHIAHMLWGGIGMMAAIVMLLVSVSRLSAEIAAVIGGAGFGVFIDELGKVVTKDNDYFYRPSVAIIYIIFVVLALVFRALARSARRSPRARLAGALEMTKEAVIRDLDADEKRRALELLAMCDPSDPLVASLTGALERVEAVPAAAPHWVVAARRRADAAYRRLAASALFERVMIGGFVVASLISLVQAAVRIVQLAADKPITTDIVVASHAVAQAGSLVASLTVGVLVVLGIAAIHRSRLAAYRWFLRATLVSIFIGQVFAFYLEQLAALIGLAVSVLIWATLRYTIDEEEHISAGTAAASGLDPGRSAWNV
jgi:hypothetical protein